MNLTPEQQRSFNSFCQRLLQKQIKPPNEFIEYMVKNLLDDRIRLQRLEENLMNLKERIHQLIGGINRCEVDINEFVMRHLFGEEEEKKPDLELIDGDKPPEEVMEKSDTEASP